jgi:hypothetical protein
MGPKEELIQAANNLGCAVIIAAFVIAFAILMAF